MTVTQAAPKRPVTGTAGAQPTLASPGPPGARHRVWMTVTVCAVVILLGAIVITVFSPAGRPNTYLDPAGAGPYGARAVTDLLGNRGQQVIAVYGPQDALAAANQPDTTLIITSPALLTSAQLGKLAAASADLVLIEPTQDSLYALAADLSISDGQASIEIADPGCGLRAATLAGSALTGGMTFTDAAPASGITGCYLISGLPSLVTYRTAGRTVTVIGTGMPFANGTLASNGNAALALNLLAARHRVVWLTPEAGTPAPAVPSSGASSGVQLIPRAAWLVFWQLAIAVLLAAGWRIRRLGPLVPERLPVVVRAAETVEGHARLYQSRRARGRAAAQLRAAMVGRILLPLGLPRGSAPEAITQAVAGRSRKPAELISWLLFGPPPGSDSELVALVRQLDELESEVRAQ